MPSQEPVWRHFDSVWYSCAYPAVREWIAQGAVTSPEAAWRERGRLLGHDPNAFFAERWYLARHPDVAASVRAGAYQSGFDHFCRHVPPHHAPHWLFDPDYYREMFARRAGRRFDHDADGHPFDHFIRQGQFEGLSGHALYDPDHHAALAPFPVRWRIKEDGPFTAFLLQIRDPAAETPTSPHFDPAWYRSRYPDVEAGIRDGRWTCALEHYLTTDRPAERDPSPRFSDPAYLGQHFDVRLAWRRGDIRNGFDHYLRHGFREGRCFLPSAAPGGGQEGSPGFPLRVQLFSEVRLLPVAADPARRGGATWGFLGADGTPLPQFDHPWFGQRRSEEPPAAVLDEAVYGGLLMSHFGHVLRDSLCRLWFLRERPDLPVVWHWTDLDVPHDGWPGWFEELWRLVGLERHVHHRVTAPLLVKRLILPASGLTAPMVLHERQARALAVCDPPARPERRKVWLSRSRLPDRFGPMIGEDMVETVLAALGWTIVHPQELPVARQVELFASEQVIAGFIGSAFHSAILSRRPSARLILVHRPLIDRTFYDAVAATLGLRQDFIDPPLVPGSPFVFWGTHELSDPVALAGEVDRMANTS